MFIKKAIKRNIKYIFDKLGLIVIPKWRIENYLLSKRLQRIILVYKIDCIFDVGANIGQYGRYLRDEVGYKGLIISFEPDPSNYKALEKASQADEQWIIKDYALGKRNEKLNFNIMESSVFNSFLDPDHTETRLYSNMNSVKEKIEVSVRRLDEVLDELNETFKFNHIFLKIDTQGFDLDVFIGSFGCLDLIRGIQTEVSVLPIYKDMPTFDESLGLFRSKGFEVSGLYSLSESRFPHAVEFDCVYVPVTDQKSVCSDTHYNQCEQLSGHPQ